MLCRYALLYVLHYFYNNLFANLKKLRHNCFTVMLCINVFYHMFALFDIVEVDTVLLRRGSYNFGSSCASLSKRAKNDTEIKLRW